MLRLAPVLVILLLVSGCPTVPVVGTPDAGDDGTCLTDDDCDDGESCKQGVCTGNSETGCARTGCPEHAFCDADGTCRPSGEKACTAASDCGGTFLCPEGLGRCIEPCVLHTDCEDGYTCNNAVGGCVECTFDTDCTADPARAHCLTDLGQCVECLDTGHCEAGYCETAAGAEGRYSCKPGCFTGNDCPACDRCIENDPGPGRCVDCTPDTQTVDCAADVPNCEPESLTCVRCFQDAHCSGETPRCHPERRCVACLEDADCPAAHLCDAATNTCVPGCNDDGKCPPDGEPAKVKCDTMLGERGACIECLDTPDCGIGEKCADSDADGYRDDCVEGCDQLTVCADGWTCNLVQDQCVMCMNDGQCPDFKSCDLASYTCVCGSQGDECSASDQCGEPANPGRDEPCHAMNTCSTQVRCGYGQPFQPMDGRCSEPCSLPDQQANCPDGYMCRVTMTAEGQQKTRCVASQWCG